MGGQLANNVDLALRNTPAAPQVHSVVAGLGGRSDHADIACIACSAAPLRNPGRVRIFSTSMKTSSARNCTTCAKFAVPGRRPRTCCAGSTRPRSPQPRSKGTPDDRSDRNRRHPEAPLLSKGDLHRRQSAGAGHRAIGAGFDRPIERADLWASCLPGMWRGAGRALRHGRGDARNRRQPDRGQRDRMFGSLHDALPGNIVANALAALAVRQCRGGRHRSSRSHAGEGAQGSAHDRAGRRWRHHRYRIWLPVRDVRAQR